MASEVLWIRCNSREEVATVKNEIEHLIASDHSFVGDMIVKIYNKASRGIYSNDNLRVSSNIQGPLVDRYGSDNVKITVSRNEKTEEVEEKNSEDRIVHALEGIERALSTSEDRIACALEGMERSLTALAACVVTLPQTEYRPNERHEFTISGSVKTSEIEY